MSGNGAPRFTGLVPIQETGALAPRNGRATVAAIAFGAAGEAWFAKAETIHAVYKLDVNDYGGIETVQLVVDYAIAV